MGRKNEKKGWRVREKKNLVRVRRISRTVKINGGIIIERLERVRNDSIVDLIIRIGRINEVATIINVIVVTIITGKWRSSINDGFWKLIWRLNSSIWCNCKYRRLIRIRLLWKYRTNRYGWKWIIWIVILILIFWNLYKFVIHIKPKFSCDFLLLLIALDKSSQNSLWVSLAKSWYSSCPLTPPP